jgi:serine/threonine protein kinase
LIDDRDGIKISDFGIAVTTDDLGAVPVEHVAGTPGFIDPIYRATKKVSESTDMYAFGMVMMETLTAKGEPVISFNFLQHLQNRIRIRMVLKPLRLGPKR